MIPPDLDLRPGSTLHARLLEDSKECFRLSERFMTERDEAWNKAEAFHRGYVDETLKDRDAKKEYVWGRSIVVPYTYAVTQTILTALLAVFTARRPMFMIEGRGPEDVAGAQGQELLVDYQFENNPIIPGIAFLYQWLFDGLKYGLGIAKVLWETREGAMTKGQLEFEGNVLVNIDPFTFYPDPRVSLARLNDGEFVGHEAWRPWTYLRERGEDLGGPYRNLDAVRTSGPPTPGPARSRRAEYLKLTEPATQGAVDGKSLGLWRVRELERRLIPADLGLGPSTRPETWIVTTINDQVVVRAEPLGYQHGCYTYVPLEPYFDLHSRLNPGAPEMMEGLQRLMNWLFNAHIANVVRVLNNLIVYDPSMVDEQYLLNPEGGGLIPIAKEFTGIPGAVERAVKQLQVFDVTKSHMQDTTAIVELIHTTMGTNAPIMGIPVETRRTLGEVQAILSAASVRMQTIARIVGAQGIRPLVQRMVANNQQFLSQARYVRILGEEQAMQFAPKAQQGRVLLGPRDLEGNFDFPVVDGTIPPEPSKMAQTWQELFLAVAQSPQLQADGWQPSEFFRELATLLHVKTIDRFRRAPVAPPVQVQPDAEIAAGVQSGRLQPIPTAMLPGAVPVNGGVAA